MPSLALIIHVVEHGIGGPVGEDAAIRACLWCAYLETHARRIYALAAHPLAPAQLLSDKLNALPNPFTVRDVCRHGWAGLSRRENVEKAVRVLCKQNYLAFEPVDSGPGRPTEKYSINPEILTEMHN